MIKCFVIDYRDDSNVFVIGKKSKKSKVTLGSVIVDLDGNVLEIHIDTKGKDLLCVPMRKDGILGWVAENDFAITEHTEILVKLKMFSKEHRKFVKEYIPYEKYIN